MPKRPHTELRCSKDGPWITLHGEQSILTFNLRELVRGLMPAEHYAHRRRVMAEWVKARDAEGKGEPVKVPPGKVGERLGPLRKPIPASRRIPPRTQAVGRISCGHARAFPPNEPAAHRPPRIVALSGAGLAAHAMATRRRCPHAPAASRWGRTATRRRM